MAEAPKAGSGERKQPENDGGKQAAGDARAERLAAQLKANLRRRKEQARGRAEPAED